MSKYTGYTPAQGQRTVRYMKEKTERIVVDMPKGRKAVYKEYAQKRGESMQGMIVRLLDEEMKNNPA